MGRDDFPSDTRTTLAKRAGYRCSKPSCRVLTVGPSRESPESVACVGIAAHISAASEGGPRYDASLTPEERRSIPNGIWLCATHATLIDRDVERFPVALLRQWKEQHEAYVETYIGENIEHLVEASVELGGKQISDAAVRILLERAPFWEHVLLAQLLRDHLRGAQDAARDLRYGVAIGKCVLIRASDLVDELQVSNEQMQLLLEAATAVLDKPTADAIGPAGVEGDADAIAYVAARLGGIYRAALDDGLKWLHTRCSWEEVNALIRLASGYGKGIIAAIDGIPDQIDQAMLIAQSYTNEVPVTHTLTVTFAMEDGLVERLGAELDRIGGIVARNGWPD